MRREIERDISSYVIAECRHNWRIIFLTRSRKTGVSLLGDARRLAKPRENCRRHFPIAVELFGVTSLSDSGFWLLAVALVNKEPRDGTKWFGFATTPGRQQPALIERAHPVTGNSLAGGIYLRITVRSTSIQSRCYNDIVITRRGVATGRGAVSFDLI